MGSGTDRKRLRGLGQSDSSETDKGWSWGRSRAFRLGQGGMFVRNSGEPVEDGAGKPHISLISATGSCRFWKAGSKGRGETKGFRRRCC